MRAGFFAAVIGLLTSGIARMRTGILEGGVVGPFAFNVLGPAFMGEGERGGVVTFFPVAAGFRTTGALGATALAGGEAFFAPVTSLGTAAFRELVALRTAGGLGVAGLGMGTGLGPGALGGETAAAFLPFNARSSSSVKRNSESLTGIES